MKIAIGCDHGGIVLKKAVIKCLTEKDIEFVDFGTYDDNSVDYPDFAEKVAVSVASGECDKGILLCGTGIGISIAANKVRGIRAAVCHNTVTAALAAEHNNANILCMGGRVVTEQEAYAMTAIWLDTPFGGARHARRVAKIIDIESSNL